MVGIGTLVNMGTILIGSTLGLILKKGLPDKYQETIMHGIGLSVIVIGLQMAFKTENIMVVIISLVLGSIIGEACDLEGELNNFGNWLGSRIAGKGSSSAGMIIGEGFIAASLIYCVGAMAIVGSLQDGLTGDASTLYAKATLDGISAIIFTANMGIGVALSALSVGLYQGLITALAGVLEPIISAQVLAELTATGGILILAIGLNMLKMVKIRIANMLPAIFLAGFLAEFFAKFK